MKIFITLYKIIRGTLFFFRKVRVTIEIESVEQRFPTGTVPGYWKIYLEKNSSQEHYYEGPYKWTIFEDVVSGTYMAYAVRVDENDNILGELISREVDISPNILSTSSNGINIS